MSDVQRYRKLPVVIEAMQWDGESGSASPIISWICSQGGSVPVSGWDGGGAYVFKIGTLEGPHDVTPGDWIIRGVAGEFYPCKPEIFAATYELVS